MWQFFKKHLIITFFFICIPHISRLFLSFSFFRKTIQSRSTRNTCRNLQKKYLRWLQTVFCALIFTFNTMFTFWEISNNFFFFFISIRLYIVYGKLTKWVSIFENFNFLYWLILFILFIFKSSRVFFVCFECLEKRKSSQTRFHFSDSQPVAILLKWIFICLWRLFQMNIIYFGQFFLKNKNCGFCYTLEWRLNDCWLSKYQKHQKINFRNFWHFEFRKIEDKKSLF